MNKIICIFVLFIFSSFANALVEPTQDWQKDLWRGLEKQHALYEEHFYISKNQQLNDYVNSILNKLVPNNKTIEIYVVNDIQVNASAYPNGRIYVNLGLLVLANNESELAAVIAHEVSHITNEHAAKDFEKGKQERSRATIAKSIGFGIGGAVTGAANSYSSSVFSVAQETQSDSQARELMKAVGFNVRSQADIHKTMKADDELYGIEEDRYFRTHPLTVDRIAATTAALSNYQAPSSAVLSVNYANIKEQALKEFIDYSLKKNYTNAIILQFQKSTFKPYANQSYVIYGMAAAYQQRGLTLKESVKQWKRWKKNDLEFAAKPTQSDVEVATALYEKLIAIEKNNVDANYGLASLYVKQDKKLQSIPLFKKFLELSDSSDDRRRFAQYYVDKSKGL